MLTLPVYDNTILKNIKNNNYKLTIHGNKRLIDFLPYIGKFCHNQQCCGSKPFLIHSGSWLLKSLRLWLRLRSKKKFKSQLRLRNTGQKSVGICSINILRGWWYGYTYYRRQDFKINGRKKTTKKPIYYKENFEWQMKYFMHTGNKNLVFPKLCVI